MKKFIFLTLILINNTLISSEINETDRQENLFVTNQFIKDYLAEISKSPEQEKTNFINCLADLIAYKNCVLKIWLIFFKAKEASNQEKKEYHELYPISDKLFEIVKNSYSLLCKSHRRIFCDLKKGDIQLLTDFKNNIKI